MSSFEQPPEWWSSLANLTQWLHWPAISAILSFTALMFTIRLADRSRREARRKDIAVLRGLAGALGIVEGVHRGLHDQLTAENYKIEVAAQIKVGMIEHFAKVIEQVKITDIPTPKSAETFVTLRAWLDRMPEWMRDWQKNDFQSVRNDLKNQIDWLALWIAIFKADADALSDEQKWSYDFTKLLSSFR